MMNIFMSALAAKETIEYFTSGVMLAIALYTAKQTLETRRNSRYKKNGKK